MGTERFYSTHSLEKQGRIDLIDTEFHHAIRVMRLSIGEYLGLIDGKGNLASAKLVSISKESAQVFIEEITFYPPPSFQIKIGVPLMRASKLEWVVEKGTELGADSFYFYRGDHSEKEQLSSHQIERLHTIAISAMKQSKRLYLPSFEFYPNLENVLKKDASISFGSLSPEAPFFKKGENPTNIFITGPEKGFSQKEHSLLKLKATPAKLSPHVLRAETAPLAALVLFHVF